MPSRQLIPRHEGVAIVEQVGPAQGRSREIREARLLVEVNDCFDEVEKGNVKARIVFELR